MYKMIFNILNNTYEMLKSINFSMTELKKKNCVYSKYFIIVDRKGVNLNLNVNIRTKFV